MAGEATRVPNPYAEPVTETNPTPGVDPYRLNTTVRPTHYDLTVAPDAQAGTFSGTVSIHVDVTEPTGELVCNAADLDITEATVTGPDGNTQAASITLHPDTERVSFAVDTELPAGPYTLTAAFAGPLDNRLRGVYRSTFTDPHGDEQHLVVTQFEATDARRAFPCWDEPAFKATFAITLVVPEGHLAVSNAAEISSAPTGDGRTEFRFATTMKMSTYLVAFVTGPLEATEPVMANGVPVRVVHPPGKAHLTDYAIEVATFCLDWFASYYDIDYPGDKLDLLAIPDFAFGAMENLGCVTFREVLLLVDPAEATQPELQNVTDVIAHELAHMWFGDLVTMDWWEGIWLNEAFATFMEMAATDAFRPDWDRWTSFAVARTAAFDVDGLRGTRPVEFPVVSPADAEAMFDILTYEKGAAVLRMCEQWLGPDAFRLGIRRYLADHAYANTTTSDLFEALETATGQPVRRIADAWFHQGGYPLVTVDLVNEGRTLRFGQQPFAFAGDRGDGTPADDRRTWPIPVTFTQSGGGVTNVERELIEPDGLDIQLVEPTEWVVANTEGTGFYRVAYAPDLLAALRTHAAADLSPVERYGLIDDAWAAVLADRFSIVDMLDLIAGFTSDNDLTVWQRIVGVLGAVNHLVDDPDARRAWEVEVTNVVSGAAGRLGPDPSDGEPDRTGHLRGVLFAALGTLAADPGVRIRAHELHQRALTNPTDVDPSLIAAAVSVVASAGGPEEFDAFVTQMRSAPTPQDEMRYLNALADFDHPELMDRVLAMCLDGTIRTQNAPYLLRRCLGHRTLGDRAWTFVSTHWEAINEAFPSNSIARMLGGIAQLDRPATANLVFGFFEHHTVPQGDQILAQHLERLEVNLALRAREANSLEHHLRHTHGV